MAWTVSFSGGSYFDGNFRFSEDFVLTQVDSTKAGWKRIKVDYSARVSDRYSGANTSYYVSSRNLSIKCGGTTYSSETACPGYYGWYGGTVYIQVPNSAAGSARMQGTICGADFTMSAVVMTLKLSPSTVTAGNNVALTVENGSGTNLTATFKYGSTTLATQSFSSGSLNLNCPAAWFDTAGVATLTSMTISVTVTGGTNAMSDSFALQAGSSMRPSVGAVTATPVQSAASAAFPNDYIAGYTSVKVAAAVTLPTSAGISRVVLSYPGGSNITASYNSSTGKYEATTPVPITADSTLTLTATDRRGLTGSASVAVTGVLGYTLPSVSIDTAYRCDENGERAAGGAYCRIKVTATHFTALSGNTLKKLTAGVKGGGGSSIVSGVASTLPGLSNSKKSYTIEVTIQDQISEEIKKEIKLEGMLRNLVLTCTDEGTHLGIGTTPESSEEKSTVELPGGGKYLVGGQPVQSLMQPIDGTDGMSFEKNLLLIDTGQRDALMHRTAFFHKDAAGVGWENVPPAYSAVEWYGLREVLWMDANHILVRVTDMAGQGYVWLNRWVQDQWSGWYALDMTSRNS